MHAEKYGKLSSKINTTRMMKKTKKYLLKADEDVTLYTR